MGLTIQIDSREKAKAIKKIIEEFNNQKVTYYTSKLYVGDYMSLDNPKMVIDRKQNMNEICGNLCSNKEEHERFTRELKRAQEVGIKVVILVEHGHGIKTLEDVKLWVNPRGVYSPKACQGDRLFKTMTTVQNKYGCTFLFCSKLETGKRIVDILSGKEVVV